MRDNLQTILKEKGHRVTKSRVAILELLYKSSTPMGAEDIKVILDKKNIATDLATIYRFLTTFVEKGILRKVEFGEGKYRYELTSLPHHHHLICNDCGKVEDITLNEDQFLRELQTKSPFKIDHHHLEFFGQCAKCQ